jgi:uncharacterized repeat protein (TIGR02543 family)
LNPKCKNLNFLITYIGIALFLIAGKILANPINDNFNNALTLNGIIGQVTGSNVNATKETGEPDHASTTGGNSIWWKWTAPADGNITLDTFDSNFDTILGVYTGNSVDNLTEIISNDDFSNQIQSQVIFDVKNGITYYIAVDGYFAETGNITLSWNNNVPPANDNFNDAIILSSAGGHTKAKNNYATKETGEPNHGGNSANKSIWWKLTTPADKSITIDTFGSLFDTLLGVYTGTSVDNLTEIISNNDNGNGFQSRVTFNALTGITYYIAVDTYSGLSANMTLNWYDTPPPPSNNNFADAITISNESGQISGNNSFATKETGEPDHANDTGGKSVWWKWTASSDEDITFDTSGSNFNTLLGVYTGTSVDNLTEITSNDNEDNTSQSRVQFNAINGTTYYIAVDGYLGANDSIILNWYNTPLPPINDNFADAITIIGENNHLTGSNLYATPEANEPKHAGNTATKSVWWKWTAPADTIISINTFGSKFDTTLSVYTGTSLDNLTAITSNDDVGDNIQSKVTINATNRTTYYIAVDGYLGESGEITLNLGKNIPNIVTNINNVIIPEGKENNFEVKLSSQPASNTTVTITNSDNISNIVIVNGGTLTFTPSNWDNYQSVTLSTTENDTDTINDFTIITCTSDDANDTNIIATEIDDDFSLTITNNGYGEVTPVNGLVDKDDAPYTITATANRGYTFINWTIESGNGIFENATMSNTTLIANDDIVINANFIERTATSLIYNTCKFKESSKNNGSIDNISPLQITLNGDTFTGYNGSNFSQNVKVTNLPLGLTAVFTKDTSTQLSVTLIGNAVKHKDTDSINNLTFSFKNSAFTGGYASEVLNNNKRDLSIHFIQGAIYSLTYIGNGNDNGVVPEDSLNPYSEGDTVTILGNIGNLSKTAYVFSNWNTKIDGTGNTYNASESFTMPASDVTLYAQWEPNENEKEKYLIVDLTDGSTSTTILPPTDLLTNDDYKTTKLVLRKIQAGTFTMGSPIDEFGRNNDEIQHQVTLTKNFYIGIFEITQAQYAMIDGFNNPSRNSEDKAPVETVSWDIVRGGIWPNTQGMPADGSWLNALNTLTNLSFDLPTEAQWEYACRAETTKAYNDYTKNEGTGSNCLIDNSEQDINLDRLGWYYYNTPTHHQEVGTKQENYWGLYDMHGNVLELCLDYYKSYNENETAITEPTNQEHICRGGSWNNNANDCRSATRFYIQPSYAYDYLGFRVVLPAGNTMPVANDQTVSVTENLAKKIKLSAMNTNQDTISFIILTQPTHGILTDEVENDALITYTPTSDYIGSDSFTFKVNDGTNDSNIATINITVSQDKNRLEKYLIVDLTNGSTSTILSTPSDFVINDDYKTTKLVLRKINAGTFTMGSPTDELGRYTNETQNQITLTKDFYIGIFEITQAQYAAIDTFSNPSTHTGDKHPVETVSWDTIRGGSWPITQGIPEAHSWLATLNTLTKLAFDLPTEAQWEYACRATTINAYNNYKQNKGDGSNCLIDGIGQDTNLDILGWYDFNTTTYHNEVGTKQENYWGLYDMHGNVLEWCLDYYNNSNEDETINQEPACRGGSWNNNANDCRSATRIHLIPSTIKANIGFRIALQIPGIITDIDSIDIPEGESAVIQVKLNSQPISDVTVSVSSENQEITAIDSNALIFTKNNWDIYQSVNLFAAEDNSDDIDDTTVITFSSDNATDKNITVTEIDDDFLLNVTTKGNGTVTPQTALVDIDDAPYSITAIANSEYTFKNWTIIEGTGNLTDENASNTSLLTSENITIMANFILATQLNYTIDGFKESSTNDGSIDNASVLKIILNGDTFTGTDGEDFSENIIIENLPEGLNVEFTKDTDKQISVIINGKALQHNNDIDNLTFTFKDSAFSEGNASSIINYSKNNLFIDFTPNNLLYVTYLGNGNDAGTVPIDSNNPYNEGDTISVLDNTGNLTKQGYSFVGWNTKPNGSGISYSATDTFTMPNTYIMLYAQWTPEQLYTLTINNGTGSGSYTENTIITISADPPTPGMQFDKWTGHTDGIADINSSETVLIMPSEDASVTATYKTDEKDTSNNITLGSIITLVSDATNSTQPKVYATYTVPVSSKQCKTGMHITNKGSTNSIKAVWKKRITLYNKKAFKNLYSQGQLLKDFTGQQNSLKLMVNVVYKNAGNLATKEFLLVPPSITEILSDSSSIKPQQEIIIKGMFFGNKAPKVWIEYKTGTQTKMARCKVIKPYKFEDIKGKIGKSCMNKTTGESEIKIQMPKKWPKDFVQGEHYIVINNKIGMASVKVSTE